MFTQARARACNREPVQVLSRAPSQIPAAGSKRVSNVTTVWGRHEVARTRIWMAGG
jgi:hypothetical protein